MVALAPDVGPPGLRKSRRLALDREAKGMRVMMEEGRGAVQRTNVRKPRTFMRNRWHSRLTSDTTLFWNVEQILANPGKCNLLLGEHLKGLVGPPSLDCGQTATAFANIQPP